MNDRPERRRATAVCSLEQTGEASRATIIGVTLVAATPAATRLAALEMHCAEMAATIDGLRRYLDQVAEMVRIAADELGESRMTTRRTVVVNNAARWPTADTSRARVAPRGVHHPVRH